jgi:hypothetical protein
MAVQFEDFKAVTGHPEYFARDLGDNGTGDGEWVELMRADGWGFGSMLTSTVEDRITADLAKPAPATGSTLKAIFVAPDPVPEQPAKV